MENVLPADSIPMPGALLNQFSAGGVNSLSDDRQVIDQLHRLEPSHVFLFIKGWEPPVADLADFIVALVNQSRRLKQILLCPEMPSGAAGHSAAAYQHILGEWQRFAEELSLSCSTSEVIFTIAPPALVNSEVTEGDGL